MKQRVTRRAEDEPPRTVSAAASPHTCAALHPLMYMQQTIGNAATKRALQRAPAENPPPAPGKPQTRIFVTMSTLDGKAIRGASKHKGREGQMELEYFRQERTGPPVGSSRPGREREREAPTTTRIGNASVTTSKDTVEFSFGKLMDDATPVLAETAASGKGVRMRVDFVRIEEQGKESLLMSFELPEAMLTHYNVANRGPDQVESMFVQSDGMSLTIPDPAAE